MIKILIGVSGSGKSTYAKEQLKLNSNMIRVNRDDLRKTLFGVEQTDKSYYERKDLRNCEKLVSELSEQIIYDALNKNKDIILDNTHLHWVYIYEIIRKFNHLSDIELKVIHDTDKSSYQVFKNRLIERFDNTEDVNYLDRQWNTFKQLKIPQTFYPKTNTILQFDKSLPKTYAFDLDGTLALKGDRDIFDESKVGLDIEINEVCEVLRGLNEKGYKIIFLSGRQDSCKEQTVKWLKDNNLWFDSEIYMRKSKDARADYIIKEELIINNVLPNYNLIGVFDDRLQVSREYFRLGIFTFNVNQNFKQF